MNRLLWQPSAEHVNAAQISKFRAHINRQHHLNLANYHELYQWSIDESETFWQAMWEFGDIRYSQNYQQILENSEDMFAAKWFGGAKLNFAENLLKNNSDKTALIFRSENGERRTVS